MMTNVDKSIAALNNLIKINDDRIEIYKTAEKRTKDNDLKVLFSGFQDTISSFISELEQEIRIMEGIPIRINKKNNFCVRCCIKLKLFFAKENREDLLNVLEYEEFVAMNKCKKSLNETSNLITIEARNLLETHYSMLNDRHDKIKELGDLMLAKHKYDKTFTF